MPLEHGPIHCLACFGDASTPGCAFHDRKWQVDNNPGYWGATDPEVLVLGFSKGANQRSSLRFDRIAFNGARKNLAEILCAVGLLENSETIDTCFTSAETKLGFASVVRGGLGVTEQLVAKRLKLGRLSPVILDAYRQDAIGLDEAQAFAITDDYAEQSGCSTIFPSGAAIPALSARR